MIKMQKTFKYFVLALFTFFIGNGSILAINVTKTVSCGKIGKFNPRNPELTSWIVTSVQVLVPVVLVIFGIIDFVKAISSQKEDEIKKGQQLFIKRAITAVIIFFMVVIVKLLVSAVSSGKPESGNVFDCIECFINNKCNK